MLESIYRGIALAAGINVPRDVRLVRNPPARSSVLRRLVAAFERRNVRRSTYRTLQQLDDRTLRDIGLDRSGLLGVADAVARRAAANDNARPVALAQLAANDNDPNPCAECG